MGRHKDRYIDKDTGESLNAIVARKQLEAMAAKANEVVERDTCKNCGALVVGHIADAGLVIEYAGYKFCSETCLNNWVDDQD